MAAAAVAAFKNQVITRVSWRLNVKNNLHRNDVQNANAHEKLAAAHHSVLAPHSHGIWDASIIPSATKEKSDWATALEQKCAVPSQTIENSKKEAKWA